MDYTSREAREVNGKDIGKTLTYKVRAHQATIVVMGILDKVKHDDVRTKVMLDGKWHRLDHYSAVWVE